MPREYHWWIGCVDPETGRPHLIYGAPDFGSAGGEDVARSRAFEMLGSIDFELKRLPTRDLSTASSLWRGKRLAQGDGLHASSQRIGHERSVSRMRQRIESRRNR
jgi:hypothetical protein